MGVIIGKDKEGSRVAIFQKLSSSKVPNLKYKRDFFFQERAGN